MEIAFKIDQLRCVLREHIFAHNEQFKFLISWRRKMKMKKINYLDRLPKFTVPLFQLFF